MAKKKPMYEEYKCPICGFDRVLEGDTWICQHCGNSEEIVKNKKANKMNRGDRVKTKTSDEFNNLNGEIAEVWDYPTEKIYRVRLNPRPKDRRLKLFRESELVKA